MFCRNCGKELIGTPEICMNCGARPSAGKSHCQACGAKTNELAEICVKCGVRLTAAKPAKVVSGDISPKSRLAATLLCILPAWFLSVFGIHRFYTGNIGAAVGMLLLTILGWATLWFWLIGVVFLAAGGIWSFIDFLIAVTGNMRDGEGKLIKNW